MNELVNVTFTVKESESKGRTLWFDPATGRKFYDDGTIVKELTLKEMEPEQKRAHRAEVKHVAKRKKVQHGA